MRKKTLIYAILIILIAAFYSIVQVREGNEINPVFIGASLAMAALLIVLGYIYRNK